MSKIIKLRDGREVYRCIDCSRDWDTVKHASLGRCRGCARVKQHQEAKPPQKWSEKFGCCQNRQCPNTINGVTSSPHNAEGLCRSCYSTKQRYVDLEHSHQVEAVRRLRDEVKEKQRVHHCNYYEENKQEYIERTTQYGQEHPEWRRACGTRYREANREICRLAYKKWYDANPKKAADIGRRNRDNNPELYRQHNRNRRARVAGAEGSFTAEEWAQVCEEHCFCCYHCGKGLDDGILLTPDHLIPIIKNGSNFITNIGPLCETCNSSKKDRDLQEFDPDYFRKRFEIRSEQV